MDHADRGRAGHDAVNKSVGKPVNECVDNVVDNVRGVGRRMNVGSRPHRDSGLNVGGGLSMDRGLNVDGGLNMDRGPNVDGGLNMDPGLNVDGGLNTDRRQNAGRVLILDGGMGRELLRRGAPFAQPEWSALALLALLSLSCCTPMAPGISWLLIAKASWAATVPTLTPKRLPCLPMLMPRSRGRWRTPWQMLMYSLVFPKEMW